MISKNCWLQYDPYRFPLFCPFFFFFFGLVEACTLSSLAWSTVHISRGEGWTVWWVDLCGVEEVFGTKKIRDMEVFLQWKVNSSSKPDLDLRGPMKGWIAHRERDFFILDGCYLGGLLLKMMRSLSKIHNWSIIHIISIDIHQWIW